MSEARLVTSGRRWDPAARACRVPGGAGARPATDRQKPPEGPQRERSTDRDRKIGRRRTGMRVHGQSSKRVWAEVSRRG